MKIAYHYVWVCSGIPNSATVFVITTSHPSIISLTETLTSMRKFPLQKQKARALIILILFFIKVCHCHYVTFLYSLSKKILS